MTLKANAKVNLYLGIIGKRGDGYHEIITEMQEIDLADTVTVRLTDAHGVRVSCDNPLIPETDNIAYRAAELFLRESGVRFGADIRVQKRIPLMSGLGGSSTDGAAVLKALNSLCGGMGEDGTASECGAVMNETELSRMGAKLGADVPFFLTGGRAECRGIGDIVTPLPDLTERYYLIIQPNFRCDTKGAYEKYDASVADGVCFPHCSENTENSDKSGNIFQLLYADARIEGICAELTANGAEKAAMSGSGSAVFGVFSDSGTAKSAFAAIKSSKSDYPYVYLAKNVMRLRG